MIADSERPIDWATLLLDYRRARGLKQSAAAADFGVSQGTISRWERGESRPTAAMQALLARVALRHRSPHDAHRWLDTFRRMLAPGVVISSDHVLEAVTPSLCQLLGVEAGELEGLPLEAAFSGQVLEIEAEITRQGFYQGRVESFEASHRLDLSARIRREAGVFVHYIGWPHFDGVGRVSAAVQGIAVTAEQSREIRERLGAVLSIRP